MSTVVAVIPNTRIADLLLHSGAFDELKLKHNLQIICSEECQLDIDLPVFQTPLAYQRSWIGSWFDHQFWNHVLFRYLRSQKIAVGTSFKAMQLRPLIRAVHVLLSFRLFHLPMRILDKYVFFRHDQKIKDFLREINPSVVIVPGSAMDSFSHMILRTATTLNIPTLMIVMHWDYFSKKGVMRTMPDKIYVWGDDMRQLAISRNGISTDQINVVGVPQFERYLNLPDGLRAKTREAYRVSDESLLVLFAGTAAPFDELSILHRLSECASRLDKDIRFIYRPHPRAWKRLGKCDLQAGSLTNVMIDDVESENGVSNDHYQSLLSAVDAMVSPFSTMILENALCGRPAFCIAFNDGINAWDFSESNNTEHIQQVSGRSWLQVCVDSSNLEQDFEKFINKMPNEINNDDVLREVKLTVYFDDNNYSTRFFNLLSAHFNLIDEVG